MDIQPTRPLEFQRHRAPFPPLGRLNNFRLAGSVQNKPHTQSNDPAYRVSLSHPGKLALEIAGFQIFLLRTLAATLAGGAVAGSEKIDSTSQAQKAFKEDRLKAGILKILELETKTPLKPLSHSETLRAPIERHGVLGLF
jgi:hypothetical protein